MRLGSNLILTRLLVPEAFGTMALVNALVMGLTMFSDMGTGPAIQKCAHGDEPEFLDTVWSVQAIRGGVLWLVAPLGWNGAVACAAALSTTTSPPERSRMMTAASAESAVVKSEFHVAIPSPCSSRTGIWFPPSARETTRDKGAMNRPMAMSHTPTRSADTEGFFNKRAI